MEAREARAAGAERAPRWVRRYVAVFLIAFAACGVIGIEVWPLTGWRLFADSRERIQTGWQAVAVSHTGREQPIDFLQLPAGYQGNVQVLNAFPGMSTAERAAVCDAWAAALRDRRQATGGMTGATHGLAAIRIYATRTDVGDRRGDRGAPPARTLRYTCTGGTVREEPADAA